MTESESIGKGSGGSSHESSRDSRELEVSVRAVVRTATKVQVTDGTIKNR